MIDKELKPLARICTMNELRLARQELLKRKAELVKEINSEFNYKTRFGEWKDRLKKRENEREIGIIKRKLCFIQDKLAIMAQKEKEQHRKERDYPEREKMEMFKEFVKILDKELYSKAWELTNEKIKKELKK
jgi:hypothetical protein